MCRWKSLPRCGHPQQLCGAGLPPLCRTRSCSRALAWGAPPGCRGLLWCCWRGFFNAFCPGAPRSCPWVRTSLYLFILADAFIGHSQACHARVPGQGDRGCPQPALAWMLLLQRGGIGGLCWRQAPRLAAASSRGVSRDLQHIPVSRDLQRHVARGGAGSLASPSSSQEVRGTQSSGQPRAPGGSAACPACASLSSRSADGVPENSQGPRGRCEIRERQPVRREDTHAYDQQFLQYKTKTSKVSKGFKKFLQVAWASRDWL